MRAGSMVSNLLIGVESAGHGNAVPAPVPGAVLHHLPVKSSASQGVREIYYGLPAQFFHDLTEFRNLGRNLQIADDRFIEKINPGFVALLHDPGMELNAPNQKFVAFPQLLCLLSSRFIVF